MNEVEGVVSGDYASGAKLRTRPGLAHVRPTRACRKPLGFIDRDAALRDGFPDRGAFLDYRLSPYGPSGPAFAARVVGSEPEGLWSNGANEADDARDPTTAEEGGRSVAHDRAGGRGEGKGW